MLAKALIFLIGLDRYSIFSEQISASTDDLRAYWRIYGGGRALFFSPALWFAAVLTMVETRIWTHRGWTDLPLGVLPSLLGFSLSALAIVFAFPSSSLFPALAEEGREDSYYLDLSSKLLHFIFVQVIALLLGVLGKAVSWHILAFVGVLAFNYAVSCAAMTALALFGVARLYNKLGGIPPPTQPKEAVTDDVQG